MALRKNVAHRLLVSLSMLSFQRKPADRPMAAAQLPLRHKLMHFPAPSEHGFLLQCSSVPLQRLSLPLGDELFRRPRCVNQGGTQRTVYLPPDRKEERAVEGAPPLSVDAARKVLRLSQAEAVKARLRATGRSSIPYPEFVRICCECSGHRERGQLLARSLDESGAVLVHGNVVFLRPEEASKAIASVILPEGAAGEGDLESEELRKVERQKAEIDARAAEGVRREMCCGLVAAAAQTAWFARLTFWELSWDVMEPICYFVTSAYFIAGYAFFLRTSHDPSFEGFFQARFATKQRRLMAAASFDLRRLEELRRAALRPAPDTTPPPPSFTDPPPSSSSSSGV